MQLQSVKIQENVRICYHTLSVGTLCAHYALKLCMSRGVPTWTCEYTQVLKANNTCRRVS